MVARRPLSVYVGLACFALSSWALAAAPLTRADHLAEISHYRDQARWVDALAAIERAQLAEPNDDLLYKLQTLTLGDIGNAHRAWSLYLARPSLFDDAQKQRLEADYVAKLVGWSLAYGRSEETQLDEATSTLALIDEYLARDGTPLERAPLRIRRDRLILLNRLDRHAQVRAEAQALQQDGSALPDYLLPVVGDSLLSARYPEEAIPLLETAIKNESSRSQTRSQLAYAYLETEQPARAIGLLEDWRKQEPPWRWNNQKTPYANWPRFEADQNLTMIHAYSGDLSTAQRNLEEMLEIAPGSTSLQNSLGSVYQMRGWPTLALERYQMAHTLDPRDIAPRAGIYDAQVALQRDDLARPFYDDLRAHYPNNATVQRLQRDWRARRGWLLYAYADGGRSSGGSGASPLGNDDRHYGIEVQSPLIDDRWRVFAFADRRSVDFRDQQINPLWLGAGIRYRFDHADAELAVQRPNDDIGDTGLRGGFGWQFNDRWHAGISAARNDPEASMQARHAGISADSVAVAVDYRRNELTQWGIGASQFRYDDGNRRETLNSNVVQRLMTRPTLLIDGLGGIYTSRGSRDDAPYFNPSRDGSVEIGLRFDQQVWRRYERHFRHRLTVSLGNYWQEGYGNALVPSAEYRHEWQLGQGRVFEYGVNWSRPVYDGQRERRIGFDAALHWGQ